jgi:hypothetical protein
VVGVGQQREREVVLRLEGGLRFYSVRAAANHGNTLALKLVEIVTDFVGFGRSASGIRPRIEVQDQRLASEVFERDFSAIVCDRGETWRLIPNG